VEMMDVAEQQQSQARSATPMAHSIRTLSDNYAKLVASLEAKEAESREFHRRQAEEAKRSRETVQEKQDELASSLLERFEALRQEVQSMHKTTLAKKASSRTSRPKKPATSGEESKLLNPRTGFPLRDPINVAAAEVVTEEQSAWIPLEPRLIEESREFLFGLAVGLENYIDLERELPARRASRAAPTSLVEAFRLQTEGETTGRSQTAGTTSAGAI